ncbi:hypothetical protein, partial [Vibrio genomosp. F10]|uniref:hypothetical protein n=1 Tax=Vibrio genomosp. F10 TaxID=723171 RepID=UPI0004752982
AGSSPAKGAIFEEASSYDEVFFCSLKTSRSKPKTFLSILSLSKVHEPNTVQVSFYSKTAEFTFPLYQQAPEGRSI